MHLGANHQVLVMKKNPLFPRLRNLPFNMDIKWLYDYLHFSDIAIALLSLFIISSILERVTRKGPMLWPVVGIAPSIILHFDHLYDWVTGSLIQSGGTFYYRGIWKGGNFGIVTADPSKIEYMLKTKFNNFPKGKYYRERFYELLGDGIFNADDDLWKQQRRAATSEMHSNRFLEYSLQTMQDLVHNKLLKLMDNVLDKSTSIDLQEVFLRFTFDNICIAAFGVDPRCLSLDLPDVPFAKAFEEATELSLFRFLLPPIVWKFMRHLGLGFEKRLKEAARVVHDFAEKTVRERKEELGHQYWGLNDRSDLLSRLISVENLYFSNNLLKDFCISFILAGRDTSSVGLAWFFWLVHKNPHVENKILVEIYEILKTKKKEVNYNDLVFTEEELKKMVYLQAALSESLRLYPPVSIDFKQVLEDDVFPDGTAVKCSARIFYCIFSMARMESVWGKDCLEFKPERWIKEGEFVSGNQFKYAVFNGGPRLCLGKKFAYMQMKMVAASVLLRYSVKVVEGHQVVPKITTTLYMKNGLMVSLEPRSKLDLGTLT